MGGLNAIAQTSVFGLGGMLPDKYTNAVMIGNGIAGVSMNLIRIICMGAFPQNAQGLLISTIIYFVIAGASLFVCSAA
jgi:equilibrative nucleoside transporter 1/2/3